MSEDQQQITAAIAERVALKKQQLGLDTPAAETADLEELHDQDLRCGCGESYRGSVLRNGDRTVRMPPACGRCRARVAGAESAEKAAAEERRTERATATGRQRRLADLAVPPKYVGVSLETFEHHGDPMSRHLQMRVLSWARRYLAQWPDVASFVAFQGGYGTGKGHVAWSLALAVVTDLGGTARVVKLPAMVRELRDTWRKDSGATYDSVLRTFVDPDLLVIDEASRHAFYGQQIHQHLYDVVDTRIELGKATILTTNEDDAGLAEVLKGALLNRLEGEGGVVPFGMASWRSRPREADAEGGTAA